MLLLYKQQEAAVTRTHCNSSDKLLLNRSTVVFPQECDDIVMVVWDEVLNP